MPNRVIIPIDPGTSAPRKGEWEGRQWVPSHPEPIVSIASNPNFVYGEYGRNWYKREETQDLIKEKHKEGYNG